MLPSQVHRVPVNHFLFIHLPHVFILFLFFPGPYCIIHAALKLEMLLFWHPVC